MRILFIENAGLMSAGAFHSLLSLIKQLRFYGIESYVALPDRADGVKLLKENNIPYIQMRSCSYTWMFPLKATKVDGIKMFIKNIIVKLSSVRLAYYAKKNGINIIHENTSACYIGSYVSKITGIRHVWHIREFMEEDFGVTIWKKFKAIRLFNHSDALIAISNSIFRKYANFIDNNRIHLIYNGVDTNVFYKPQKQIFKGKIERVLCVGRVCEGKGQIYLIKAACILKQKYNINLEIFIAGIYEKTDFDNITSLALEYGIEDNIKFLGQCNNIVDLYDKCDILCMSSRCEAFGRVTVEGMLSGNLIIGANSGGTSEIIQNGINGLLFSPEDAEDLAMCLYYALGHKNDMQLLAAAGRSYAFEKFSAKINAERIYYLYNDILN